MKLWLLMLLLGGCTDQALVTMISGKTVACEVIGATDRTADEPNWSLAHVGKAKPVDGYCINVANVHEHVAVDPRWPVNLGAYAEIEGLVCEVVIDRYRFTCDWPPYKSPR